MPKSDKRARKLPKRVIRFNKEFKVIRNEKGRVTLGEDIYFCNQSKEVYCDTDIQCKHRIAGDHWDYDVD